MKDLRDDIYPLSNKTTWSPICLGVTFSFSSSSSSTYALIYLVNEPSVDCFRSASLFEPFLVIGHRRLKSLALDFLFEKDPIASIKDSI